MKGYKITKEGVRNLNNTASAVQKLLKNGTKGNLPFRQNERKGGGGATLKIGKTTAEWVKGTDATLEVWKRNEAGDMEAVANEDGTAVTFTAYNLFADVESDKFVACLSGYLIAAECA